MDYVKRRDSTYLEQFSIIDAPSILGLRPTGVEHLPEALKAAGLMSELSAECGGRVFPLSYNSERDKSTLLLNPDSIRAFSLQLAEAVAFVLHKKRFPLVLGGDCSILIGNLLALRRLGRYGLFFIDGHADVLDDSIMPAVDYRLGGGGGLSFSELSELLKSLVASDHAVGMDITIFNPRLDLDGSIARRFVSTLVQGLS